jgi:predicted N-acetyltransferase YhbS
MIAHFDFFGFYNTLIIVACNENDEIIGYCGLKNGNELGQVYVKPKYREQGLVHVLVWKAVEAALAGGSKVLWGVAYPHVKDIYIGYIERFGATLVEEEQAEDRADGQWKGVFDISTVDPDRRPEFSQ